VSSPFRQAGWNIKHATQNASGMYTQQLLTVHQSTTFVVLPTALLLALYVRNRLALRHDCSPTAGRGRPCTRAALFQWSGVSVDWQHPTPPSTSSHHAQSHHASVRYRRAQQHETTDRTAITQDAPMLTQLTRCMHVLRTCDIRRIRTDIGNPGIT
jgi:hypothetical protein